MGVSYRRRGSKWHIRFTAAGKKEIVKAYPGSLHESTIQKKVAWWEEEIALEREDPWEKQPDGIIDDLVDEYLAVNLENGNWSKSTHAGNKSVLTRLIEPVNGKYFSHIDFQKLYEELPGAAQTKRSDRTRINAFLSSCHKQGLPRRRVELPMSAVLEMRNTDSIKYLTWHQVNRICKAYQFLCRQNARIWNNHVQDPDLFPDLWWFMFYSLLRKEEVPRLRVSDLRGSILRVQGKGRRTDTIVLPPPALAIAKKYAKGKRDDAPLFVTHMGQVKYHLGKAVRLALGEDHPRGFHQLRHGGIVHYLSLGKPVQFVSKLARHRSIQVTLTVYADVIPDSMEQVFSDVEHRPLD